MTSKATPHDAPHTIQLLMDLHSTLEIKQIILCFTEELIHQFQCDGVHYAHTPTHTTVTFGKQATNCLDFHLKTDTEFLGDLTIMRTTEFTNIEILQLEESLLYLMSSLKNAITYTLALESARHDPLTGLHNRITLDSELNREMKLAQRHQLPLSILMVDLDDFKEINDQYGHLAGDAVLKNFAHILKATCRETDLLYRLGGEEFLIVLSNTTREGAEAIGHRIRVTLESSACNFEHHLLRATASIGITTLAQNDNIESFLNRADQALYRAKEEGKNRLSG